MSTERFTKVEFEEALDEILDPLQPLEWVEIGLIGGEYRYEIPVKEDPHVSILINSSISINNIAADTGENSIRIWMVGEDDRPVGNKTQSYITRLPNWQSRMTDAIEDVVEMARAVKWCPTCGEVQKVFVAKRGQNKGRAFRKCDNGCNFVWIDELEPDAPSCPDCGHPLVIRESKWGEFYGCTRYPDCTGKATLREAEDLHSMQTLKGKVKGKAEEAVQQILDFNKDEAIEELEEKISDFQDRSLERLNEGRRHAHQSVGPSYADEDLPISKKTLDKEIDANVAKKSGAPKKFVPSKYQVAIFDWVQESEPGENAVVEACAGSGKTMTLEKSVGYIPKTARIIDLAFNRHIAKEMSGRLPSHVDVSTYHSFGLGALRDGIDGLTNDSIDNRKVHMLFKQVLDWEQYGHIYSPVKQMVSLVKANLSDTDDDSLEAIADHYGIVMNGHEELAFMATRRIVELSKEVTDIIDFDDMCWLPIVLNLPVPKYDYIGIDEAQDTNRNQIELALRAAHDDSRIIAVGDRYQSMYGFRGADVNAIPNLIEGLNAETLPLSITYRCPKAVVELVNRELPEIPFEAAEWAIDGAVSEVPYAALRTATPGDMVLCRTNAPLVKPAFGMIRDGKKAVIVGRDIGKGLVELIDKMKASTLPELISKLRDYMDREYEKLILANKKGRAESLRDRVETIIAVTDGCSTIQETISKILNVFRDDVEGIAFSTVHRAKGLEADNVWILKPELMPHPRAESAWEMEQERNIKYVAYTRAKKELLFVRGY